MGTRSEIPALARQDRAPTPTQSQARAIEAPAGPTLVLAGPGAGKTFCLIERIHCLVNRDRIDPARVCAFTFTNKAAGEISDRLESRLGMQSSLIVRGTIHAFCADLLRNHPTAVGLATGFGIADEDYQREILRRLEGFRRWHGSTLTRFSAHRLRGDSLLPNDQLLFGRYEQFLSKRNLIDFDTIILKAVELLEQTAAAAAIRGAFDAILVDEFQDLNPTQYRLIRALAQDHRHVFAVGDDDQSIYSWAGADPTVFRSFVNDFAVGTIVHLEENRRCPRHVFALARTLVNENAPLFEDRAEPRAEKKSEFPVQALTFDDDAGETNWLVADVERDHKEHGHDWGEVALLYRKHSIGEQLESALVSAGIPCRLAQGRALSDDAIIAYVIAALRVIAHPTDDVLRDTFIGRMLPKELFDEARAQAEAGSHSLPRHLHYQASRLPRSDPNARHIRRALADLQNLAALGQAHGTLASLVEDLLSRRIGSSRSPLEERHDEIADPAGLPDVVALSERIREARDSARTIWLPRMGGVEIGLKGILAAAGVLQVRAGGEPDDSVTAIRPDDVPSVGIALGVFKAAQLIGSPTSAHSFVDFTAIDLETTDNRVDRAEIIEIAAVRVRNGRVVETFESLVRPRGPIPPAATDVHGIRDADVATAPTIENVWPLFRAFCGSDIIVAHNGYDFDFPVLRRATKNMRPRFDLCTYDTLPLARSLFPTSRKLGDLARQFGVDPGRSHRALDDTRALAEVTLALEHAKAARARKTSLPNALDFLAVALALEGSKVQLCQEAEMLRGVTRVFALSQFSSCLETYEREQGDDLSIPTVDEVIEKLGGADLLQRVRSTKSAADRYPVAMARLKRLLEGLPGASLNEQLPVFLERALLSKHDGHTATRDSVNLLTFHSTKGLEFSRVYVVGAEDAELPGGSGAKALTKAEIEEGRRLLYVGMTRARDRLVLTRCAVRSGKQTGGHQFLDEMGLIPGPPELNPI